MTKLTNSLAGGSHKVLQFDQSGDFYYRRGLNKLDDNNLPEAMVNYRKALLCDPENAEIKLAIAETLTEMDRYDESNRLLFTLFTTDDRPSECYFGMGCNFVGMQEYERAKDSFLRYLEVDPEGDFIYDAYDMLDALDESNGLADAKLAEAERLSRQGKSMLENDDYTGAIETMNKLLKLTPNESYAQNNLALAHFCNRDYKQATALVKEILEREPNNVQARCNLAIFLRAAHDEAAAGAEMDKINLSRLEDIDDLNRVAITLMEMGRFEDALPLQKKLYQRLPYDTGVIHRLAVCSYEAGSFHEAASCYDRLIKLDEKDSVARYYRGLCRAAAAGKPRKKGAFMFNYQVPLDEMLSRVHKLNDMLSKPHSELKRQWQEDLQMESLLRWGSQLPEHSVKHAVLVLAASFADARAEIFLRDFLLQKQQPNEVKREAFGLLKQMNAKEPYLGYLGGELVESRVNLVKALPDNAPQPYREVIEICFKQMAQSERPESCLLAAAGIWGEYVSALSGYPRLSGPRIYAFAAALEYLACRSIQEKVAKTALCRQYGVSLARFNSALARLANHEPTEEET